MLGRLVGATFNYGLGNILPQVVGFFLIPVYTVFLSPGDYGVMDLAASTGGVLVILMRLGVTGAVTRFYYDYHEGAGLRDYVTTTAWFLLVSSLVVGAGAALAWYFWGERFVPGLAFYPYILLVVISAIMSGNSDLQRRLIQAREQSSYSAKLSVVTSLSLTGLALLLVTVLRLGVTGILLAQALVNCAFFLQATLYLAPDLRGRFQAPALRSSVVYAMGVLPSHFMGALAPLVTRSILAHEASLANVGLLAVAARFTAPLTILGGAFSAAYLPVYFSVRKEGTRESLVKLAEIERMVWLAAVACGLGAALVGPPVIRLMIPERFHAASGVVPILAIGFLAQILYTLLCPEIFYSKKTWFLSLVTAVSAVTTVGVTVALAGRHGEYGVAWAIVAGFGGSALVSSIISSRLAPIPHDWPALVRTLTVAVGVALLARRLAGGDPLRAVAVGGAALAAFLFVLWVIGDEAVRTVVSELRQRGRRA